MTSVSHYADFLRERLQERLSANPRYSLRAFARDLGLHPSRLSEVLNRKQGLSEEVARKICKRLALAEADANLFCQMVLACDARSKRKRLAAQSVLAAASTEVELRQIQEDTFKIISDWYHYTLLELTLTRGFKSDPTWIARRLGISKFEVEEAIKRLARLELLEVKETKLRATGIALTTTSGVASESIRKFNRQVIEKALAAVSLQTVLERDLGTLTSAIHTDDLNDIKEMIRRQRRELNQFIMKRNQKRAPNEVYCLATQFFRLTNRITK